MDYAEESLRLHYAWKGKLEITPRAAVDSKDALISGLYPRCCPTLPRNSEESPQRATS